MNVKYAIILTLLLLVIPQKPKAVECGITKLEMGMIEGANGLWQKKIFASVSCGETELFIPETEWPEAWAGPFEIGAKYQARWTDGHLNAIPTFQFCKMTAIKEMDRFCRGKNDNCKNNWTRFLPANCEGVK